MDVIYKQTPQPAEKQLSVRFSSSDVGIEGRRKRKERTNIKVIDIERIVIWIAPELFCLCTTGNEEKWWRNRADLEGSTAAFDLVLSSNGTKFPHIEIMKVWESACGWKRMKCPHFGYWKMYGGIMHWKCRGKICALKHVRRHTHSLYINF